MEHPRDDEANDAFAEQPASTIPPEPLPLAADPMAPVPVAAIRLPRWLAFLQVLLVCGIPTQIFVFAVLWAAGMEPMIDGEISIEFVALLSLFDTALIALLISLFLQSAGESSRGVFLGNRPVGREIWLGVVLVPLVLFALASVVLLIRRFAPSLQTVEESPYLGLMENPIDAVVFLVVVIIAGGVREELARAFILHRFKHYLGGVKVGLVVFSLLFGAMHFDQGLDVALAIGLLGLLWGILYIRRGSFVAPLVNHAGFNAIQVIAMTAARTMGL